MKISENIFRNLKVLICSAFVLCAIVSRGQEFSIKKIELTSEGIILHYDLIDTVKKRLYSINLYSSRDNFLTPLHKISGDAGLEVRPGSNKKISWSSKEELGKEFQGGIELEIRGRVYIPFVRFESLQENQVFKRGKPKTITWTGGTRQNILNFALYNKDNKYVEVIPNIANSGHHDLTLPTSVKPGKGYYFLVSDSKNKDQVMKTGTFQVKRKIPLLLKIVPIAVIGALIPFLGSSKGPGIIDGPPDFPGDKH